MPIPFDDLVDEDEIATGVPFDDGDDEVIYEDAAYELDEREDAYLDTNPFGVG